MIRYLVHWLERGPQTPARTEFAESRAACADAVERLACDFARDMGRADPDAFAFAQDVRRDTMEQVDRTPPSEACDPRAPSVTVGFPVRTQCGTLWATPCLVVVPVRAEAFQ